MIEKSTVSSFIMHNGKILLLKRTHEREYSRGKWGVVSGSIEKGETPDEAAMREISEEISLRPKDLKMIRKVEMLKIPEEKENVVWVVHPFLFEVKSDKIKINEEHLEYRWVEPKDVRNFDYVIGLDQDMKALGLSD